MGSRPMPLRDHFRPPVSLRASWEGVHGIWPGKMIDRLNMVLPAGYAAEPRVHLGAMYEIDIGTFETDGAAADFDPVPEAGGSAAATAVLAEPDPTLTIETELQDQYEYAVRVFDTTRGRRLVAAVEIVSPANKDRPENRRAFVAKAAAMLQQGVCVSLVDLVTHMHFNLYADLLELIGRSDAGSEPSPAYAVTLRGRKAGRRSVIDTWAYPLEVGRPLPPLPVWLSDRLWVPLDLEASYEDACRALRIG